MLFDLWKWKRLFCIVFLVLMLSPIGLAAEEAATGDLEAITTPLNRVYDIIKLVVGVVGMIVISYAGFKFMLARDNLQARDAAKQTLAYAMLGLAVIWVAPHVVTYMLA